MYAVPKAQSGLAQASLAQSTVFRKPTFGIVPRVTLNDTDADERVHEPTQGPKGHDERELVRRAQAGEQSALSALLILHGPPVYRSVLLPRLGSEAAAKDALSETYTKVLTKLHLFTWQSSGFYPWFRTVALHVALDHLRARKKFAVAKTCAEEALEAEVSGALSADQAIEEEEDRRRAKTVVQSALARLNPRYAKAITLRVLEDKPREEVASILQLSPATFDVLLHRALTALKKELGHG
jgi:RNA polymerase sigma factor (sigma-70 family)